MHLTIDLGGQARFGPDVEWIDAIDYTVDPRRSDSFYAAVRLRRGEGPMFLECRTYRWREHVGPNEDYESGYRERTDLLQWIENDQMSRLGRMIGDARRTAIDSEIENEIEAAVAFAESSPFPDAAALCHNVFAER